MRLASVYSVAEKLIRKIKDNPAYGLFTAFLLSIFFFKGGVANAVAVICFAASWLLIAREARGSEFPMPLIAPIVLTFLIASGLRLLLPPYGIAGAVPGSGLSHVVLLAGFYGLILFVQSRLRFSQIMRLIAVAAFACVILTLIVTPKFDDRLLLIGRTDNPILAAGAIAAGVIAAITLLAYHADIRRAPLTVVLLAFLVCGMLTGVYLAGSRGPLLALVFALCVTPLIVSKGSRTLLFVCAFGAYALVTASVLLAAPIRHVLCPTIELACRDPSRSDVWMQSLDTIAQHPLWGVGYAFRFEGIPHAHNTYLGMALHYGIPLALFFVCVMAVALSQASKLKNKDEKFFIVAMLIFANGFMASDLSEPLRFFNTHYVFLWLPVFLAMMRPAIARRASSQMDEHFNATT